MVSSVCWRCRGAGGDALYATPYAGGCRGGLCLREASEVSEVLDAMRRVLLSMLEAGSVSSVCWTCWT